MNREMDPSLCVSAVIVVLAIGASVAAVRLAPAACIPDDTSPSAREAPGPNQRSSPPSAPTVITPKKNVMEAQTSNRPAEMEVALETLQKLGFKYQGCTASGEQVPPEVDSFSVEVLGGLRRHDEQIVESAYVTRDAEPGVEQESQALLKKQLAGYLSDAGFQLADNDGEWELLVLWGKDTPGGTIVQKKTGHPMIDERIQLSTRGTIFFLHTSQKQLVFATEVTADFSYYDVQLVKQSLSGLAVVHVFAQRIADSFDDQLANAKSAKKK